MSALLDMLDAMEPPALADLQARSLGSDEDREAWLKARTNCVTATEAKLLTAASSATGRKRVLADLIDEKINGSKFAGNHFTEWGKLREPFILAELEKMFGIAGCGLLVHAEGNSRHAATPDGAGVNFDGALELAEIKTSKNDVLVGTPGFERAGYFLQMQWQMYCTGAARVLYVVERHDNDWSGWDLDDRSTWLVETGPKPHPIVCTWVYRDDEVIAQMVAHADEALAALDAAREQSEADDVVAALDTEVDAIAARVLEGRVAEAAGKKAKESAWGELLTRFKEAGAEVDQSGVAKVRYVPAVSETVDVPDEEAARAAHPKEWTQLERARKWVADLESAWSGLQAEHKKKETREGKPSLTVTRVKTVKGKAA